MKHDTRADYVTRDTILKLLSDEEIARVAAVEAATSLTPGAEYVDLDEPDVGVRRAHGHSRTPMGRVLPREAVLEQTWREIVALLSAHRIGGKRRSLG